MKLIVVDVGNTSTAVGLWSNGRVSKLSHIDGGLTEAVASAAMLAKREKNVDAVAYASVVPRKDAAFKKAFKSLALEFVALDWRDFGLKLDYPDKASIGIDRLADATGAVERYGAGLIVMDFGTALTAAVITDDKVWRGGVIAPGFPLMRDYLFERTAKLPRMEMGRGKAPKIGRSTEEAMRFGALVGYRGMVREIVSELERNFNTNFKLVATGGFAKWVLKDAKMDFVIDSDLTIYGAGLMAMRRLQK
jgi:type III pantothenate kinase